MRLNAKINVTKPIPSGFVHKQGSYSTWVQFCYKYMSDIYYNCGMMGHLLAACLQSKRQESSKNDFLYEPWIRAELSAYTLVFEGSFLYRIEIP